MDEFCGLVQASAVHQETRIVQHKLFRKINWSFWNRLAAHSGLEHGIGLSSGGFGRLCYFIKNL